MPDKRSKDRSKTSQRSFCKWKGKHIWVWRRRANDASFVTLNVFELRKENDSTECERSGTIVQRRTGDAATLVSARRFGSNRFEIWLRCWLVRRLYRARQRTSDAILRN